MKDDVAIHMHINSTNIKPYLLESKEKRVIKIMSFSFKFFSIFLYISTLMIITGVWKIVKIKLVHTYMHAVLCSNSQMQ